MLKSHLQQAACLVSTLCFPTLLCCSLQEEGGRWEEIDRGGLKRRGMERKKKKAGWEFRRSRAFDADREWKQLPWKLHPASNESMSKKKNIVNGGIRQSELLTKGFCLICLTTNIKAHLCTNCVSASAPSKKRPHLKSLNMVLSDFHAAPRLRAADWSLSVSELDYTYIY